MDDKNDVLIKILGADNVIDDSDTLDAYSRDQSFVPSMKPRFVVKPKNADEVQDIVKWANQTLTPLVPVSSGPPHFRGDTIPSLPEAVIVDLSRMTQIIRISRRDRITIIEPGVTFSQLQPELEKEGLRLNAPLCPRSSKSVIGSLLEREPIMIPRYQWNLADPLRSLSLIWGNGDRFVTGDAGVHRADLAEQWKRHLAQVQGMGPGQVDYHRLLQGSQGTMGIVTWAAVRCELLPLVRKLFFAPSEKLDNLLDFAYRVLRFRFCDEILFLNSFTLASILEEREDQVRALREMLPSWVLILGIAGRERLPKERVEFLEKDIRDIAQQFGVELYSAIPGAKDVRVQESLLSLSKQPDWKLAYKGGCQNIFFLTTLNRAPEFVKTMYSLSQEWGYTPLEIGTYIQPVQQGAACHCEFSLPYDPSNQREVAKVQGLFTKASEALVKQGAYFSRPYGIWANAVYNRDAQSTIVLKKIKGIFDPNSVMNPGKLCH